MKHGSASDDSNGWVGEPHATSFLCHPRIREEALIAIRGELDRWNRDLFSSLDVAEWILEALESSLRL